MGGDAVRWLCAGAVPSAGVARRSVHAQSSVSGMLQSASVPTWRAQDSAAWSSRKCTVELLTRAKLAEVGQFTFAAAREHRCEEAASQMEG
ncbi:hypothetical protein SVAN01_03311 [Stagonosporopsis vannaccii]|nr:hypothetical protein SVAN01_03311 [Stagonosporopsis vannaccii]